MICYIRRSTIDYDIRLHKYINACVETSTPYFAITWDRLLNCKKQYPHEIQLKTKAPYGGGWKNIRGLIMWCFFVYWNLLKNFRRYKVIHACDFDAVILAFPLKLFGKKIVFDIYDSSRYRKAEIFMCKKSDMLILPNKLRFEQLGIKQTDVKRFLEIENVPQFETRPNGDSVIDISKPIKLAYVGVFQRNIRGLENLLKLVDEDNRFELDIAGSGDSFDDIVYNYSRKCHRIHFHGVVNYKKALEIMGDSHFIIALYYLLAPIHKFASPNKYYESLFLNIPIITSSGTLVGNQVKNNDTGYVISDDYPSLKNLFSDIFENYFIEEYDSKKKNCSSLWAQKYSSYFNDILKGEYIDAIKQL